MMTIRELFEELKSGMTQTQFAAMIGVTQVSVSLILSGKRRPGPKVVKGLLKAFPERRGEILAVFFGEAINAG